MTEQVATPADSVQNTPTPNLGAPLDAQTMADIDKAMGIAPAADAPPPEAAPAAAPSQPQAEAQAAPVEEEIPEFTAVLRAREKARAEIDRGKSEAEQLREQIIAEAKAQAERVIREANEQAVREKLAWRSRFRESPLAAIKEHGEIDPEQLVNEVVKEGSPEWKLIQSERAKRVALEEQVTKLAEKDKQRDEEQEQFKKWQERQHRERTLQEFVGMIAPDSGVRSAAEQLAKIAAPFLPNMARAEDWLTLFGDEAHAQFVQASNGKAVADLKKLVQHLEYQARGQARVSGGAGQAPSTAAQGQRAATGQRTLSAQSASERRAAPKRSYDMTPDELRAYMLEGVEEAMRGQK